MKCKFKQFITHRSLLLEAFPPLLLERKLLANIAGNDLPIFKRNNLRELLNKNVNSQSLQCIFLAKLVCKFLD